MQFLLSGLIIVVLCNLFVDHLLHLLFFSFLGLQLRCCTRFCCWLLFRPIYQCLRCFCWCYLLLLNSSSSHFTCFFTFVAVMFFFFSSGTSVISTSEFGSCCCTGPGGLVGGLGAGYSRRALGLCARTAEHPLRGPSGEGLGPIIMEPWAHFIINFFHYFLPYESGLCYHSLAMGHSPWCLTQHK